jgi:tight adherence protein B
MEYSYYLFIVLGFVAVFLFFEGLYSAWDASKGPEAKRIQRRLQSLASSTSSSSNKLIKQRLLAESPALESILLNLPRIYQLDRMLLRSGLQLNVANYLGLMLIAAVFMLVMALLLGLSKLAIVGATLFGALLPWIYVKRATVKRKDAIEEQLPDALDLMARAMLAGHAFPSALKMVGDEMPEPISGEFRIAFDEVNYGISVHDALTNLIERVNSTDMNYFVISVLLQRETGGNLAELLGNLSQLIRERLKLLGAVRVLSAEGRLSAQILTALPFVVAMVINLVNPEFMKVLWTDPTGLQFVGGALLLMLVGYYWMRRIIKIRV